MQGLVIAVKAGDRAAKGRAFGALVGYYCLQGRYAKAIKLHGQSLTSGGDG